MFGFRVDTVSDISDVGGRLWRMTYEKNGAELVWLEREDEVKTFVIAFKTLPEDDTGVAHILEHSVLAGSEKYPVKSPFDEMRKSSVRVFMNAMTSRDATYYPFSTRNDKDFLNLADVYLDAVFHPLSLKQPMAFEQEGWHYELSDGAKELSVNGVVYNEMKGVFALPDRRAYRELTSALYPDIVYGHDSGGRPECIPDLTYDKYRAFHQRFYHPSNARIFLDGKVDIKKTLAKLDEVLSGYERLEVNAKIGLQKPVSKTVRIPFASANCDHKTIFAQGWSVGTITDDPAYIHALDVLVEYLCGSNEAPLKKALLSKHLCKDVSMGNFEYKQIPLFVIMKDTSDEQIDECRKVVNETLAKLVADGFDKERLNAIINKDEFSERELNTSRPRGLCHFSRVLRQWLYGSDPTPALNISEIYGLLRAGLEKGWFEKIVRERMLSNEHKVEILLTPDATLAKTNAEQEKAKFEKLKSQMTDDAIRELVCHAEQLKNYQKRSDAQFDIDKIPRLKSEELSKNGLPIDAAISNVNSTTYINVRPTADGVCYLTLYFPMDGLDEAQLLAMPLFARLHGKLNTSKHSAFELQTLMAANLGRMTFSTASTERGRYFKVSLAMLAAKTNAAFDLLREILFDTQFDDLAKIETILRQKQLAAERDVSDDGRDIGLRVTKRSLSERWTIADLLHGEAQLRWLQRTKADCALQKTFRVIANRLFSRNGMIVSYTANIPCEVQKTIEDTFREVPQQNIRIGKTSSGKNVYSIDGDTGFAVWTAALPAGIIPTGAMKVAAKILSLEYLHREVREIGGAYGIIMRVTDSGTVDCMSYRDPNPQQTLKTMSGIGSALRKFVESGNDIDRYIVATIAAMDPYRPPASEAARSVELFVDCRDFEDEERIRREVLATTNEQLLEVADLLDSVAPSAKTCIVGGRNQLSGIASEDIMRIMEEE